MGTYGQPRTPARTTGVTLTSVKGFATHVVPGRSIAGADILQLELVPYHGGVGAMLPATCTSGQLVGHGGVDVRLRLAEALLPQRAHRRWKPQPRKRL